MLADETTVWDPLRPAAIGSLLGATIVKARWPLKVPKSVPAVEPVIPIEDKREDSQTKTGTFTERNLVVTFVEATVEEMTTICLPEASEAWAAVAAFTVTVMPSACNRLFTTASPALRVVFPTTSNAGPPVTAAVRVVSPSFGLVPQPWTMRNSTRRTRCREVVAFMVAATL